MNVRIVCQIPPADNNPRNSEGAFIRNQNGDILFAYSRYHGESSHDHAACDIAMISSSDEGETWSDARIIASAVDFGVQNIMSVSAVEQLNGDIAFYFLIKEKDFSTTLGRAVSSDGVDFKAERCTAIFPKAYYIVNNDRIVRLSDGKLVAPAAYVSTQDIGGGKPCTCKTTCLVSEDDGKSFYKADFDLSTHDRINVGFGLQEPGILENEDGSLYLWMRTGYGRQYEARSEGDLNCFTGLEPSRFTSPNSPMQIKAFDGVRYAIYNPIPRYNGRYEAPGTAGRTPIVIQKSIDGGQSFGALNTLEDDTSRGYCYPAIFKTRDVSLLIAYCRGSIEDGGTLCRLGISKVEIASVK